MTAVTTCAKRDHWTSWGGCAGHLVGARAGLHGAKSRDGQTRWEAAADAVAGNLLGSLDSSGSSGRTLRALQRSGLIQGSSLSKKSQNEERHTRWSDGPRLLFIHIFSQKIKKSKLPRACYPAVILPPSPSALLTHPSRSPPL